MHFKDKQEKILGVLPKAALNKTENPVIGIAWVQVDENETLVIEQDVYRIRNWPSSIRLELLAILMALYTVLKKSMIKIFIDSESAIAKIQEG
ncbi:1554_t:CDS:2 [Gigaspora margarita]|uniref:1554_t:CDS:1 n=1 Tax=Gigaspora margarita TaxID=4874 RepID=A0ABN7UZI6_GIGMA|nr:1554_t:CDS:2 [Gigaspora margarita]